MLLNGYKKEIVRIECNPSFQGVGCIAHLDEDIGEALPYLNSELGGYQYIKDPPSVTFKAHGKLITLHSKKITVNALKDAEEADKILKWLKNQVNETWEHRNEIEPRFEGLGSPNILELIKMLPKTNCKECGDPTCMVFATRLADGAKGVFDCPHLTKENQEGLKKYLAPFQINY